MKVLWKVPAATVAQVRAALPRPLAYTTVMTVLDRMSAKGAVARRKSGRAYLYSAVLDIEAARLDAVHRLLANLFENDRDALLRYAASLRAGQLTPTSPRPAPAARASRKAERKPAAAREAFVPPHIDESLL